MDIVEIEAMATKIANCFFGDLDDKLKIKESIIHLVALSCKGYTNDINFKNQVDGYLRYKGL